MGHALLQQVTLETEECCMCGTLFAMSSALRRTARESADVWFFCPNGHRQHYTKSEADRLRGMLEEANRKNTELANRVQAAQAAEKKAVNDRKRIERRVSRGVCPCCSRTFSNLARHMATKHPDAAKEHANG